MSEGGFQLLFVCLLGLSFVHSFACLFVYSFVFLFVRSYIHRALPYAVLLRHYRAWTQRFLNNRTIRFLSFSQQNNYFFFVNGLLTFPLASRVGGEINSLKISSYLLEHPNYFEYLTGGKLNDLWSPLTFIPPLKGFNGFTDRLKKGVALCYDIVPFKGSTDSLCLS